MNPVGTMAQGALAVASAGGLVVRFALEALKVAQRVIADQDHVAAAATVAAVGPAARDARLTAERVAAVAAVAALHEDSSFVVEHGKRRRPLTWRASHPRSHRTARRREGPRSALR